MIGLNSIERRLLLIGGCLISIGSVVTGLIYGFQYGLSFLAGGVLSAVNLAWLRHTIHSALRRPERNKFRAVSGFILRLLLIPLCLYAIIRLLFMGIIAAIAGFAVFSSCILIEGVLEAFRKGSR